MSVSLKLVNLIECCCIYPLKLHRSTFMQKILNLRKGIVFIPFCCVYFLFLDLKKARQLGLPSSFFDELLFNTLHSIDWQSFKSGNGQTKEIFPKKNQKNEQKKSAVSKIHLFT